MFTNRSINEKKETMNTEHNNRHKLVEAHIHQHRIASQIRARHAFNAITAKPKPNAGTIRERQTNERFGF